MSTLKSGNTQQITNNNHLNSLKNYKGRFQIS